MLKVLYRALLFPLGYLRSNNGDNVTIVIILYRFMEDEEGNCYTLLFITEN